MTGLIIFCVAVSAFTLGVLFFALFRSKRGEDLDIAHLGLFLVTDEEEEK